MSEVDTMRNWRADPHFVARERQSRSQGVIHARKVAQAAAGVLLPQAVSTLAAFLQDQEVSASVRARIAVKVLDWCGAGDAAPYPAGDPWGDLLCQLQESASEAELAEAAEGDSC